MMVYFISVGSCLQLKLNSVDSCLKLNSVGGCCLSILGCIYQIIIEENSTREACVFLFERDIFLQITSLAEVN